MITKTCLFVHQLIKRNAPLGVLVATCILLLTSHCARLLPLEGGPMDTIPPQLVSTYPVHQRTNFKGKEIELTFDKEVQVQNIYHKLFVSPKLPMLKNTPGFRCKVRGETVIIVLDTLLEEETTYTFHFNDAIQDTKEKTPAHDPVLTFSTGSYVDSLYVAGYVKYLMTDKPASESIVCLYKITDTDTTHILNSKPDYLATADAQGNFKLENIKAATYRICAGLSKKKEFILDDAEDPYGFIPEPLVVQESIDSLQLNIVEANIADCKIASMQPCNQYFEISFNKPIVNYALQLAHAYKRFKAATLYSHLLEDKMTIRVYNSLGLLEDDIIEAQLTAEDAMDNRIEQLVKIQFIDKMAPKAEFKFSIDPPANTKMKPPFFKAKLAFSKPIKQVRPNKIYCVVGLADTVYLQEQDLVPSLSQDVITIEKKFNMPHLLVPQPIDTTQQGGMPFVRLQLKKGAITSIEKEENKETSYQFFVKKESECGSIKGRSNNSCTRIYYTAIRF